MDKAKSSLENNEFSLWPKASDNENTTDVGWLLYSTRVQDEERLLSLLSRLTGENLRVKWKPIRANNANIKKKDQPAEEKVKALHVECAVERLQEIKDKLNHWYSSSFTRFPDGTKMRLVPTISSVTSLDNRVKFASCLARQAALTAGLASAVTREISTNLLLDKKDPSTNKSFLQILMEITPENKPGSTLFHTIDRQFKSDVVVNFQFHPEHASEANNLIAGLVPFLKDSGHAYHLKMFTPEAIQRQVKSKWDAEKREAHSEADIELQNLLAKDDDHNFTDEPTLDKEGLQNGTNDNSDLAVSLNVPDFPLDHMPSMRREDDSVSTFHHGNTVILTEDDDDEEELDETFILKPSSPVGILWMPKPQDPDAVSRISMSDSASRISLLETELSAMDKAFHIELGKLQEQAINQAQSQLLHGSLLTEILGMLKNSTLNNDSLPTQPEVVNPPQVQDAGGSIGVAGHG